MRPADLLTSCGCSSPLPGGRTVELHIMHKYPADFYGCNMRALVHGFIRWLLFV